MTYSSGSAGHEVAASDASPTVVSLSPSKPAFNFSVPPPVENRSSGESRDLPETTEASLIAALSYDASGPDIFVHKETPGATHHFRPVVPLAIAAVIGVLHVILKMNAARGWLLLPYMAAILAAFAAVGWASKTRKDLALNTALSAFAVALAIMLTQATISHWQPGTSAPAAPAAHAGVALR